MRPLALSERSNARDCWMAGRPGAPTFFRDLYSFLDNKMRVDNERTPLLRWPAPWGAAERTKAVAPFDQRLCGTDKAERIQEQAGRCVRETISL